MERDYAYQRQIRYYVNVDIDKIIVTAKLERHSTSGGGKYKGILQQLIMERDYAYQRQIRYYVNVDIDKIMRRLS